MKKSNFTLIELLVETVIIVIRKSILIVLDLSVLVLLIISHLKLCRQNFSAHFNGRQPPALKPVVLDLQLRIVTCDLRATTGKPGR